jgi:hypothetical protein
LSPTVFVDVCLAEPQMKLGGEILGGVDGCAIDFGAVDIFGAERVVRFATNAKIPAALDIALEGDDDFATVSAPTILEPPFPAEAVVRAAPFARGRGRIIVTTDAANILGDTIEIEVTAGGEARE